MKKHGLEQQKTLVACMAAAMLVLIGCGGMESAPITATDQPLESAPPWMAELNLPACGCTADQLDHKLLNPYDSQLVIALVDGEPSCVADYPRRPLDRVDDRIGAPTLVTPPPGGMNPVANVLPEDDPVPIKPKQESGDTNTTNNDNGSSSKDHSAGDAPEADNDSTVLAGKSFTVSAADDPVPIRDIRQLHTTN